MQNNEDLQIAPDQSTDFLAFEEDPANSSLFIDEATTVTNASIFDTSDVNQRLLLLGRDRLDSLDVRQHNQNESIYFTDQATNLTVNSIELTINESSSVAETVNSRQFLNGLSRASSDLDSAQKETLRQYQIGGDVAVSISISTTAGILAWMLRGGALFGSLMAATPLWSQIDPLRITGADKDSKDKAQDSVEKIFE